MLRSPSRAVITVLLLGSIPSGARAQLAAAQLVVHEWGTITTRHTASGEPVGKLNRIDASELLPDFVHRYEPPTKPEVAARTKSATVPGNPDVTMRLETPVIYFYPRNNATSIAPFNLQVQFRGGIISEFYPNAEPKVEVDVDRINSKISAGVVSAWDGVVLDNYVVGSIRWRGLLLAPAADIPTTQSPIWLAPRRVRATSVRLATGEGERYLFYRGVAHLDALLQTRIKNKVLQLSVPRKLHWLTERQLILPRVWVVKVKQKGAAGFQEFKQVSINKGSAEPLASIALDDPTLMESAAQYGALRESLRQALIDSGLYADEALAMLATWEHAYFNAPGLRVFYIVPRSWIDYFLPLTISIPSDITRVLIGRIDLLD